MAHHAEGIVVREQDDEGKAVRYRRAEFVEVHVETPVARYEDRLFACADARADRGAHAEAHRSQAAARNESARLFEGVILRGPHLVLAHVRRDGVAFIGKVFRRGDDFLRSGEFRRVFFVFLVSVDLFQPVCAIRLIEKGKKRF